MSNVRGRSKKNYRPSGTTSPIALRLPKDVFVTLQRRADRQGIKVSEYLKQRVIYDTRRAHKKKE